MSTIAEILLEIRPEEDFTKSDNFIRDGLLDSFDVVTLVAELEQRFDISIAGQDVTPENFTNFAALQHLVQRYSNVDQSRSRAQITGGR